MSGADPIWWSEARRLREKGMALAAIGRLVKKDHTAVLFATDPDFRDRRRLASKERSSRYGYNQKSRDDCFRHKVVQAAHYEAEATGVHVDLILIAWGERPRRQRVRA